MALLLTEAEVGKLLTMQECIQAVEEAFRHLGEGVATNRPRQRLRLPNGFMHLMPAADLALGAMGFKSYTSFRGGARFLVNLYNAESGELLAILEASHLGQVRTGAASGVATKYLARADASTVGVIGTGYQAQAQVQAVCAVRRIQEVKAFSRTAERRDAFAQQLAASLGIPVRPVATAEECVRGADILITITNAREPVFDGAWLQDGAHINAAGSNHWMRREVDETTLQRSAFIVVDDLEQAKLECGELIWAMERATLRWEQVRELRDVVTGHIPSRQRDSDITLFESQGLALEDIAAAWRVYQLAREQGVGRVIPV